MSSVVFIEGVIVGEHSIIDGDCDAISTSIMMQWFVGEHSIIDGDCDKFFIHPRSAKSRRAFHN